MNRLVLFLVCFIGFFGAVWSQQSSNPFEMKHRLPQTASAAVGKGAANPFDVVPHRPPGVSRALTENNTLPFRPSSFLPRDGDTLPDVALFWILSGMFAFLTFCVAANRKVVSKAWRGFLNDNGLAVAHREASGFVGLAPYFLLYGSFLLNAGMFIFLLVRIYKRDVFNNWLFLLLCLVAALAIFLTKHIFLNVAGWLFPVEKEAARYNFLVVIFNCVLGLFLLPFNFLLAFTTKMEAFPSISGNYSYFLGFWTLGLVAIFYVYRGLRSASIGSKFLADNQFHFLLYLCAVEIAPALLLIKLALIQARV